MKHKNSVLVIEDAERVISDRQGHGSSAGVSNILNLTDGILGDCLNIQIIATFNMARERIDSALLRKGRLDPIAPEVKLNAQLPKLLGDSFRVNFALFIAVGAVILTTIILNRTSLGFQIRAVGANSLAARTAGMSVPFVMTTVMFLCGALAGLAGAAQVLGSEYALTAGVAGSFGFDAITVALLGRAKPVGTLFAGLLFAALRAGGLTMQASTTTPIDIVLVIQALIILFIAAPSLVKSIFRLKESNTEKELSARGWNV